MPRTRQGFIFCVPIESPWGTKTVSGIDISPMVNASNGEWNEVIGVWEARDAETTCRYAVGDAVYVLSGVEAFVMGEKTISQVHETNIRASLKKGEFDPIYKDVSTVNLMAEVKRQMTEQAKLAPPNIVVPKGMRMAN